MKTKFKFIAILGLFFFTISSEEGCQDPREDKDLYGPEGEINQGWEEVFGNHSACLAGFNEGVDIQNEDSWLKKLISEKSQVEFVFDLFVDEDPYTEAYNLEHVVKRKWGNSYLYHAIYKANFNNHKYLTESHELATQTYNCEGELLYVYNGEYFTFLDNASNLVVTENDEDAVYDAYMTFFYYYFGDASSTLNLNSDEAEWSL